MSKVINIIKTNDTVNRAFKTFLQAFFGVVVVAIPAANANSDGLTLPVVLSVVAAGLAAGGSAVYNAFIKPWLDARAAAK